MLTTMVLAATLAGTPAPADPPGNATLPASQPTVTREAPLAEAIAHFRSLEAYRVTIHSFHGDGEEFIRYTYKKPGYVRMEFIKPHAGAVLVYSPLSGRVHLWPFGYGHFPELNLSPTNPLIRSPRGQYVNHSDVGALFENTRKLQESGGTEVLGEEKMHGHMVLHMLTTGARGYVLDGVHSIEMWMDPTTWFPVRIVSRDRMGVLIEDVTMEGLELNPPAPDSLFNP
jgi:outer membrane lipoprotein-sorting protein